MFLRWKINIIIYNLEIDRIFNVDIMIYTPLVVIICLLLSIKHDLARSCFQFWLKIGDEGDKISRKKLARR